jgi:hypothetical protein
MKWRRNHHEMIINNFFNVLINFNLENVDARAVKVQLITRADAVGTLRLPHGAPRFPVVCSSSVQKDDEVDEDRATHHNGFTYAWTLPSRILRIFS